MANTLFPCSLMELLRNPSLARPKQNPDARYRDRRYDLYDTSYLYKRAFEACVRTSPEVIAYDSAGSWRAAFKAVAQLGHRRIYRKSAERLVDAGAATTRPPRSHPISDQATTR